MELVTRVRIICMCEEHRPVEIEESTSSSTSFLPSILFTMHFTRLAIPTVASLVAVQAHPGHDIKEEIAHMARAHEFHKRDISSCYSKLKARGHHQRTPIEDTRSSRTSEPSVVSPLPRCLHHQTSRSPRTLRPRLQRRSKHQPSLHHPLLPHRQLQRHLHRQQFLHSRPGSNRKPLSTSAANTCAPTCAKPPSNWASISFSIIKVIDTSAYEPVPDVYIDFCYANSTGTYSGVTDASVPGNINATFARGIQATGEEGATQFTAFHLGHYQGTAQHIHVATHVALPNGTYQGSTVSHIGQLFFDTSLSNQTEALTPHSTNPNPGSTTNANDGIFLQEATLGDPVVEYSLLGCTLSEGLFGWIAFGIDPTRAGSIQAAAALTSNGGVPVVGGGGGGGPGGPPPNGTFPGGPRPSTSSGAATLTSSSVGG
ncbi:hypothetical protein EAF00_008086 [Botryotinia globosa]|nr:hypothetical protein EAF00_008086 [Botryotinia globosa]